MLLSLLHQLFINLEGLDSYIETNELYEVDYMNKCCLLNGYENS